MTTTNLTEQELTAATDVTVENTTGTEPTTASTTPETTLDRLIKERVGNFTLNISPADLKYVKNLLKNKIEWKGPNEAYLLLMSTISITSILAELDDRSSDRVAVDISLSTIEAINFFLNRVTGKGEESAHRIFAISMLIRPALEHMKSLDDLITAEKAANTTDK